MLYISDGTYSLKSIPKDRFFKKLFMEILFTFKVFASAESKSPMKYFSYFVFNVRLGARVLALRLISQHTTY